MRLPDMRGLLEIQTTRDLTPDMEPATDREGVVRMDEHNNPLHRAKVIANEPGNDFDVTVSLWIRKPPSRAIPRGAMVQPEGNVTITPWVDDRTHRLAYSITADTIVPVQTMAGRHQEGTDE